MRRIVIVFLIAIVGLVAGRVTAGEPPRFPLIWQSRSDPNSDRIDVTRIHDPEAGVNCYVAAGPSWVPIHGVTGSWVFNGHAEAHIPAISCVKVR